LLQCTAIVSHYPQPQTRIHSPPPPPTPQNHLGLPPWRLLSALLQRPAAAPAAAATADPKATLFIASHPAFRAALLRWLIFNADGVLGELFAAAAEGLGGGAQGGGGTSECFRVLTGLGWVGSG